MSAPPHKRRAGAGRQRHRGLFAGSLLCLVGLFLMGLGYASLGPQPAEPDGVARPLVRPQETGQRPWQAAAASQPVPVISPERARTLLAEIAPLQLPMHGSDDTGVTSKLLCFCLDKGPETVRELRRLAADKFMQGVEAFADARYQAAAAAFGQAIQRHPREARAFVNRGLAYAHLQRYPEAKADLTQATALQETLAEAYYGRALIAIFTGDRDGANADMQQAARLGDARARRLSQMAIQPVREGS